MSLAQLYAVPFIQITGDDLDGIKPALVQDNVGLDKLVAELQTGRAQFWRLEADDAVAVAVTNIGETPSGRELNIWLMAGVGPHSYRDLCLSTFLCYGRRMGCKRVVAQTTASLAEYYKNTMDFKISGVAVSKEIEDG